MRRLRDLFAFHFATGFGSGFAPVTPGTFGSLVGILFVWLLFPENLLGQMIYLVLVTGLAVWSSGWLAEVEGQKDPGKIVADEIAGQAFVFFLLPIGSVSQWQTLLAGFALFRLFDIVKPPPIRRMESLPGGWGIVMDDVLAGLFANIVLQIGIRLF